MLLWIQWQGSESWFPLRQCNPNQTAGFSSVRLVRRYLGPRWLNRLGLASKSWGVVSMPPIQQFRVVAQLVSSSSCSSTVGFWTSCPWSGNRSGKQSESEALRAWTARCQPNMHVSGSKVEKTGFREIDPNVSVPMICLNQNRFIPIQYHIAVCTRVCCGAPWSQLHNH